MQMAAHALLLTALLRFGAAALVPTATVVPIAVPSGCQLAATLRNASGGGCGGALSVCLAGTVTGHSGICACYHAYAGCYARAGCSELYPFADYRYCLEEQMCPTEACTSGAATGFTLGALSLLAAAAGTWAAARSRHE